MKIRTISRAAAGGLLTTGMLAVTGLAGAPASNASCISVFGIGNNDQCKSGPTSIAIALGDAAVASALGMFSIAFANGLGLPEPESRENDNSAFALTGAQDGTRGAFSLAYARGLAGAWSLGNFSAAIATGTKASASAWGDYLNIAVNIGVDAEEGPGPVTSEAVVAGGSANLAAVIGGSSRNNDNLAVAYGRFNVAANIFTDGSVANAGFWNPLEPLIGPPSEEATASVAFNVGGARNTVSALRGPYAIAGTLDRSDLTLTQNGTGITINEDVQEPMATSKAAATRASAMKAARPAAKATAESGTTRTRNNRVR